MFNVAFDWPGAEIPQLASLFEDREKGTVTQWWYRRFRQVAEADYSGRSTT
jgi:hypothetical protein